MPSYPSYIDWVREYCLSLPHARERVQWQHDLLLCIGQKMFCLINLEPAMYPGKLAFKCMPEKFAELVEIEGIVPAPYMARNHWVSVTDLNALRPDQMKVLIRDSYEMVLAKLPKKIQAELSNPLKAPFSRKKKGGNQAGRKGPRRRRGKKR